MRWYAIFNTDKLTMCLVVGLNHTLRTLQVMLHASNRKILSVQVFWIFNSQVTKSFQMRLSHSSSSLLLGLIVLCSLGLGHESIIVGGLINELRGHKELQASWQTVKEYCIMWNAEVRIQGGLKHYSNRKVFPTFSSNIYNV